MMRDLRSVGEVGLIRRFARSLRQPASVRVGIGDDTAVLQFTGREDLLFASDMQVEGTHFRLAKGSRVQPGYVTPQQVGWKALACNISDIAAMGGKPTYAVVSIGLPPRTPVVVTDAIGRGLRACAERFGMALVGGDTTRAPQIVIDVAILGVVPKGKAVLRSGARPNDAVFVTGRLGGSLRSGRHARFTPRVREAQWLVTNARPHAMMDLSDGLGRDLWNLARASRVTIEIEEALIPLARSAGGLANALYDGEDFELLFTVASSTAEWLLRMVDGVEVNRIGQVTGRGPGVRLRDLSGRVKPLADRAFRHF